jgi:hypothetical protein
MKANTWNFINAEGKTIKTVTCSTREQAYNKAKFLYPDLYKFIEIKKGEQRDIGECFECVVQIQRHLFYPMIPETCCACGDEKKHFIPIK